MVEYSWNLLLVSCSEQSRKLRKRCLRVGSARQHRRPTRPSLFTQCDLPSVLPALMGMRFERSTACALLGTVTVRTPFLNVAFTAPSSTSLDVDGCLNGCNPQLTGSLMKRCQTISISIERGPIPTGISQPRQW